MKRKKKIPDYSSMIKNIMEYHDGTSEILYYDDPPHEYHWEGQLVPSCSNIAKIITPSIVIGKWTAKKSAEKFKELIKPKKSYDKIELDDFYDQIKGAADASMNEAGEVGTEVHDAFEKYILSKKEPNFDNEQMAKSFATFKNWYLQQTGLEIVKTEALILSRKHFYTGTFDALFKNDKGELIIYDWKTSSGIRDSHIIQCYLYALALEEQFNTKVPQGVIVNSTREGKLNIKTFEIGQEQHEIALACLKLFFFSNPNKGRQNVI